VLLPSRPGHASAVFPPAVFLSEQSYRVIMVDSNGFDDDAGGRR